METLTSKIKSVIKLEKKLNRVKIRNGRIKDKEQIGKLWQEFIDFHIKITGREIDLVDNAQDKFLDWFGKNVRSRTKKAIIAEYEDEIIGYLMGGIQERPDIFKYKYMGFIFDIMVTEKWRNEGIGSILIKEFLKWTKEKDLHHVDLYVVPENEKALKFYNKHDFKTLLYSMRNELKS